MNGVPTDYLPADVQKAMADQEKAARENALPSTAEAVRLLPSQFREPPASCSPEELWNLFVQECVRNH